MTGALLFLTWRSTVNHARVRLRRLRQPRYLIGTIAGLAYFYFLVWRPRSSSGRPQPGVLTFVERLRGPIEIGGSLLLMLTTALSWILPHRGSPLQFTRAEVQFLFTAPVSRRTLVRYKLLRSQLGVILGAALLTVFFRPSSAAGGWMFFAGMTMVTTIVSLHSVGAGLRRASLADHGRSGWKWNAVPVGIVIAIAVVIVARIAIEAPRLSSLPASASLMAEIQRIGTTGLTGAVLWPFRQLVRLPLSATPSEFFAALPFALVLLAAGYVWAMTSDAAFEEASAEAAEKLARVMKPGTSTPRVGPKARPAPFALGLSGRPETAILWKNLIVLSRYASWVTIILVAPLVIVVAIVVSMADVVSQGLGLVALVGAGFTTLLGPQTSSNDLRMDLANLAVIKTWPVRGAAIVRGEVMAPVVVLSVLVGALVGVAAILIDVGPGGEHLPFLDRVSYALAIVSLACGLIAVQVVGQNALALMFPAWVRIGPARPGGVEAMGQRVVLMAISFLVLMIALIPAAIAAALVGFALSLVMTGPPVVLPSLVALGVLLVECWLVTTLLGQVLERTDLSAVDAAE
jgi:ABC-2 type transport system permease protein